MTATLVTSDGKTPQLQCPSGTHIEIIGAWADIMDPNGICSNIQSSTFKLSCGFTDDMTSAITCQTDTDCAPGMTCSGTKQCVPIACSTNSDCGTTACADLYADVGSKCDGDNPYTFTSDSGLACIDGVIHMDPPSGQCLYCDTRRWTGVPDASGNKGFCAQSPTCANIGSDPDTPKNPTCTSNGSNGNGCIPRDASAYLAEQCDGKSSCPINWNPSVATYFGPKPCNIKVEWTPPDTPNGTVPPYETLPMVSGWAGGQPGSGQYVSGTQPATYSQGFYVHGIYNCIPDST